MRASFTVGGVIVAVLACSSSLPRQVPPDRTDDDGVVVSSPIGADHGPSDAAPWLIDTPPDAPPPPPASDCPASFAAATSATGTCAFNELCSYPEGSCACSTPPHCGGAAPPRDEPRGWRCVPAARADGCPGRTPLDGSPCKNAGQVCDYTCSCVLTATCRKRRWVIEHGACKP